MLYFQYVLPVTISRTMADQWSKLCSYNGRRVPRGQNSTNFYLAIHHRVLAFGRVVFSQWTRRQEGFEVRSNSRRRWDAVQNEVSSQRAENKAPNKGVFLEGEEAAPRSRCSAVRIVRFEAISHTSRGCYTIVCDYSASLATPLVE